ncbi:MAG: hypothetical protein ACU83N_00635 [Gammaproteobacteria bacterium]
MKYCYYWLVLLSLVSNGALGRSAENLPGQHVELNFFWSHRCPHCLEAQPFVESLADKYGWLTVKSYDLLDHPDNVRRYIAMAKALNRPANAVPAFLFCGQMLVGYDSPAGMGLNLERQLEACHRALPAERKETVVQLPFIGAVDYQKFSLPVLTLMIASLDAFNPCAFFVLLFLLSLMVHTRSRLRITVIGATFVLFSGILYFLFMAAWLNLFLLTKQLAIVTFLAGLIAMLFGLLNIKDYFYFKKGLSLSISESARPKLFERIRKLVQAGRWPVMLGATAVLAVVANSYELLCTAGLPMVYTRVLTLHRLSIDYYYFYLALYNVVYVIPLLLIVVIYTWTLGGRKLSESQGRLLKLLSGSMMLGLGGMLLLAPGLLNNMLASASILGVAMVLTLIGYLFERLQRRSD